ncbi:hypothetical protein HED60_10600 [Planctomycetales bacterium ZRK34]|nr:hypothetical protein HED60_10600 [Planctomycetales bacterium ZRK34]
MIQPRQFMQYAVALMIVMTFVTGANAAVTALFDPDFTQAGSTSDFNEIQDAQWTLDTGSGVYNNTITSQSNASSTAVNVTNVGSGTDFIISAQFTLDSLTGSDTTIGFGILSPDGNLTDGSGSYYLADVAMSGRIRILELNSSAPTVTSIINDAIDDLTTGTLYTIILAGMYTGGDLQLTFHVSDGSQGAQVSVTDTGTVLTGPYFGLRNRSGGAGSLDADFSKFTIAVPSPAALPAGLTLMTLIGLRRHSRA